MTEVLLFHHAQGRTPGFLAFADELRAAGHSVHDPDLFDGRTFDLLHEGVAYVTEIGFATIIERGVQVADGLPDTRCPPGTKAGADPARSPRRTAVPLLRSVGGVRFLVAGRRPGSDPRHGGGSLLRG
jgi:hypothetical protein